MVVHITVLTNGLVMAYVICMIVTHAIISWLMVFSMAEIVNQVINDIVKTIWTFLQVNVLLHSPDSERK